VQVRDGSSRFTPRLSDDERQTIAYLRNNCRLSTYAVARLTDCSHATVSRIARDIPEPDGPRVRALNDPEVLELAQADDTP
jgi:hypothetical protein